MRCNYLFLLIALLASACSGQKNVQMSNEVSPALNIPCFPGAYYRKAVTSFDYWTGISGVVILGYPQVDESRLDNKTRLPLDNFSVYMGGNAAGKQEVDAGLTWEFSLDSAGRKTERRNSWRPFWRVNSWQNAPNRPEFIWKPGDKVLMSVKMCAPEKLRLTIEDLNNPKKVFSVDFDAPGFNFNSLLQFKRVNAIDQSQNEGKLVKPTAAKVVGAEWLNTMLYRGAEEQFPMNKRRYTDMRCNDAAHIRVTTTNAAIGAEKIDLFGKPG